MNSVNLIGRLVAEPELRYTPNGAAVANFRIAVNNSGAFISQDEGYEAGFFNVVAWSKTAENIANYCGKGREVAVQGRLSQRSWDGEDDVRHYTIEVIAERVDFLREPQGAESSDQAEPPKGGNKGGAKGGKPQGNKKPQGDASRGRK